VEKVRLGVIFGSDLEVDVGFWVKNGGGQVNLKGLGRIGKKKVFKNVRKQYRNL
jgi:hypothetical protein